jgi:hypothetical protein
VKFLLFILFVLLCGCAKTLDQAAVLPPQPSFRINKMRVRDDAQSLRTIVFLYDHRNRLIVRKVQETGRMLQQFVYDGSELTSIVVYNENGDVAYVNEHPMYSKNFGKVMEFYYLSPGEQGTLDTNNVLYHYENSRIIEIKHRFRPGGTRGVSTEYRKHFEYDMYNNLSYVTSYQDGTIVEQKKVLTTDQSPNSLKHLSPLVFIFGDLPYYSGTGENNVTAYECNGVFIGLEYTYSANGFPLSIRDSRDDHVRYEFEYSE